MTKHSFSLALVLTSFLLTIGATSIQAQAAALDAYLEAQISANRITGLALAVAYADGSVDVRTYGDNIRPETRFRIGSLSKAMTAVAVLQLAEQGLIDLDAPIQTYLPSFTTQNPDWARRITVRHLLNQTSGLSDRGYDSMANARPLEELTRSFASARHDAEPGTQFAYFNGNYDLLGRIVEVVSGQRYSAYTRERLLTPAGMGHALVYDDPTQTQMGADGLAQGHILLYGFPIPYDEPMPISAPSGGIMASGEDMAAFLRQFVVAEPTILSADSLEAMLSVPASVETPYAMGWFVEVREDEARVFTHSGDVMTFHADMALLPDEGIAFALLYNQQSLLSGFVTYPEIRDGVMAILRGGEAASGGLSASVIGLVILVISVIVVVSDTRRLLASRRWVAHTQGQSVVRRGLSLALLPIPLYVLLLLPSLSLMLIGRALNYAVLIAYLPDIMLLLAATATLSMLTLAARLIFWLREHQLMHKPQA
ncbi:serine hydrolase domain-containing protein [Aggregatilineales bacterium SYSU G02658]